MEWKKVVWRAAPLLLIIMLISYFAGDGWGAIPSALVAWGTILLAYMTYEAIRNSNEREKRRRDDELAKEKRNREERLLNEIIEWAENVLAIINKYPTVHFEQLEDLLIRANVLKAKHYNILEALQSSSFDQERAQVSAAIEELKNFVEQADKHVPGGGRKQRVPVPTNLEPTLIKLIEKAAKIKTRDIGKEEHMSKEGESARSSEITLKDIGKHLTKIEGYVIQIRKNMKAQGVGGLGFTSMAAGMALVATGVQTTGGLVIFGAGLIVALYSFYFM